MQMVVDGVNEKAFTLPHKVVMMGDTADATFHDGFHHGEPERDVHGYGDTVLRDDEVKFAADPNQESNRDPFPLLIPEHKLGKRI